ncbi:MAG TPA: amino acid adenylation domain-containing protein [Pirellulales bacterium]|nr:amino acid adenylation domain-containing protein [Pirellulales bacterium]
MTSTDQVSSLDSTQVLAPQLESVAAVHVWFEDQVQRAPDAVAVEFDGARWTYRQLNAIANRLAHRLIAMGVGPETLVGIHLQRSAEMVAALLAVFKAGGAYLPLDPGYPAARLAFMLEDSKAPVVIGNDTALDSLDGYHGKLVTFAGLDDYPADNPNLDHAPSDLAYVIYTSGSTGKPKGVQIEQGSMLNFLASMVKEPGLTPRDTLAAVTSLSFDIHVLELFLPLIVGACVVVVPREIAIDGIRLRNLLARSKATVMQATPATWRLLLTSGWTRSEKLGKALCGGEAMPPKLADELLARCDEVWNMYGPTETTVWATVHRLRSSVGAIPIGHAIDHTTVYILDEHHQPVTGDQPGELYIGGRQVGRGYLNRPELTAERFVRDPFDATGDARMYRTGDLVRRLPGGALDCLGRLDHQVKIRGYRIEQGEIEAALAAHPQIRTAVVHARDDGSGEKQLIAYIVPSVRPGPTPHALIAMLADRLPAYMIPAAFVTLEELPLTPNGKVDRNALPAPHSRPALKNAAELPANPVEVRLHKLWEEVLDVRPIGVEDSFLELGGNSLQCMRLLLSIEREFGRSLFATALAPSTTIRDLAQLLDRQADASPQTSLISLHGGAKPALYVVPGIGGIPMDLFEFAPHFDGDRALSTFRAPGLEDSRQPLETVEQLAAHYLYDLRAEQPTGPYLLAGWSFGALVAFEMACQLDRAGEQVAYLGLIDEFAPRTYDRPISLREMLIIGRRLVTRRFKPQHPAAAVGDLAQPVEAANAQELPWWRRAWERVRQRLGYPPSAAFDPLAAFAHLPEGLQVVVSAHLKAERAYRPRAYHGAVVVYRTHEQRNGLRPDPEDRGWQHYVAGQVTVRRVPGNHFTILKNPNATPLAQVIQADLKQALPKP